MPHFLPQWKRRPKWGASKPLDTNNSPSLFTFHYDFFSARTIVHRHIMHLEKKMEKTNEKKRDDENVTNEER